MEDNSTPQTVYRNVTISTRQNVINVLSKVCTYCRQNIMNLMERKCLVTENQRDFMKNEEFLR